MTDGCSRAPDDAHEWVSFEDEEEERTWVFDVTFLSSRWRCIFGSGCQGVLTGPAPELVQGCCSYGAHFTDADDVERVERAAAAMPAEHWQFRSKGITKKGVLRVSRVNKDGDTVTRHVEDACIFLNRPGFENGPGCALHQHAVATGARPLDLKPNVCWQLPLRREDADDGAGHVTSTIRQWDRKHWGAGGFEFHWWCTEAPDAFVDDKPVFETMRDEIVALVGEPVYERLLGYLRDRREGYLPHPAVRTRPN